ncbi:MAG: YjfB family protein [Anaerotignaceae bacterium]
MDVAAASIDFSLMKVQQQANLSVTKNAMELQEVVADGLINMLNESNPLASFGDVGRILDVNA